MHLKLLKKFPETPDCFTFVFETPKDFTWQAGQFIRIKLPHATPDARGVNRFFSISSAPFEKNIQITTRINSQGSSFKNELMSLQEGSEVEITGPMGDFTLEDPNKKYVFLVGGIGITPVRSILLDLYITQKAQTDVNLFFANKDEVIFKNDFEQIKNSNFKPHYLLSPQRIDANIIMEKVPNFKKHLFYISGPERMVEDMEQMLLEMGVLKEQIKCDYFQGYD